MAFNLNKNDGSGLKLDLKKKSNSKFDLSKEESGGTPNRKRNTGSKSWLRGIVALIILAFGAWYVNSRSNEDNSDTIQNDSIVETKQNTNIEEKKANDGELGSEKTSDLIAEESPEEIGTVNATNEVRSGNETSTKPIAENKTAEEKNKTTLSNKKPVINNKVTATFKKAGTGPENIDSEIVEQIKSYLENNIKGSITIFGFASSEGDLASNKIISQARADNFKNYLILQGISADKIISMGKGIDDPIANNDTEEGRQMNRRVEVTVK